MSILKQLQETMDNLGKPEKINNLEDLQQTVKLFVKNNVNMEDMGSDETKVEPVLQVTEILVDVSNAEEFDIDEEYKRFSDNTIIDNWQMNYTSRLADVDNDGIATYEIEINDLNRI